MSSGYTTNMGMIPVQNIPPSSTNPFGFQAPAGLTQEQALHNKQLIIDSNEQLQMLIDAMNPKPVFVPPPANTPPATITTINSDNPLYPTTFDPNKPAPEAPAQINPKFYFIVGGAVALAMLMMKK
jgi:hypothetical protein